MLAVHSMVILVRLARGGLDALGGSVYLFIVLPHQLIERLRCRSSGPLIGRFGLVEVILQLGKAGLEYGSVVMMLVGPPAGPSPDH